jgi:hypothetical protein
MILDSEEQRTNLIQIITSLPLQGNLQAMSQNVQALSELLNAVKNAKIEQVKVEENGPTTKGN